VDSPNFFWQVRKHTHEELTDAELYSKRYVCMCCNAPSDVQISEVLKSKLMDNDVLCWLGSVQQLQEKVLKEHLLKAWAVLFILSAPPTPTLLSLLSLAHEKKKEIFVVSIGSAYIPLETPATLQLKIPFFKISNEHDDNGYYRLIYCLQLQDKHNSLMDSIHDTEQQILHSTRELERLL
jgi:hypothetical protein